MSLPPEDRKMVESAVKKLGLSVRSIERIMTGSSTENYIVSTGEKRVLARYYPSSPLDPGSEFRVLKRLHNHGLPVPEQFLFHPTGDGTRPFVLMEFIEGEMLAEKFLSGNVTDGDIKKFLNHLIEIHRTDWQQLFQAVNLPDYEREPYAYAERLHRGRRAEAEELGLDQRTAQVLDWMENNSTVGLTNPVLIHGDYHPLNIIVRPEGEYVILDWEGVDIGDHRKDVAFTALTIGILGGKEMERQITELYGSISGNSTEQIDYFIVTEAFHRIIKFYRMLEGLATDEIEPLYRQLYTYLTHRIHDITGIDLAQELPLDIQ
ncbi:MAG: phosphotransferase family protein [Candidatus Kariarchaeaceae archaeon]